MLSPVYIAKQNDIAAERAAKRESIPYLPFNIDEVNRWRGSRGAFPFPSIGNYVPEGYQRVEQLLCDSSGLGASNEPALTKTQLCDYIEQHIADNYSYAIGDVGQFQVNVNVFKRSQ